MDAKLTALGAPLPQAMVRQIFVRNLGSGLQHVQTVLSMQQNTLSLQKLIEAASQMVADTVGLGTGPGVHPGSTKDRAGTMTQAQAATSTAGGVNPDIVCFKCGKKGHPKFRCPEGAGAKGGSAAGGSSPATGSGSYCYYCERPGHWDKDCKTAAADKKKKREAAHSATDSHMEYAQAASVAMKASTAPRKHCWLLDSGASKHIAAGHTKVRDAQPADDIEGIQIASGDVLTSPLRGSLSLVLPDSKELHLAGVLQHPGMNSNLMSCSALVAQPDVRGIWIGKKEATVHGADGGTILKAPLQGGVYVFDPEVTSGTNNEYADAYMSTLGTGEIWHARLGHFAPSTLLRAATLDLLVEGSEFSKEGHHRCDACMLGQAKKVPFVQERRQSEGAKELLGCVDVDISGPFPRSVDHKSYRLDILERYTGLGTAYMLDTKAEAGDAVILWLKQAKNKHGRHPIEVHSDGGMEFLGGRLKAYCEEHGERIAKRSERCTRANGGTGGVPVLTVSASKGTENKECV